MFDILPEGRFVIKAMSSSYISKEVMARLNIEDDLDYHYRRVSKRPRNPTSSPNQLEKDLIALFEKNRTLSFWEEDAHVGDELYHVVARPVVFNNSCMTCHGDPKDAPLELLEMYGDKDGFHYQPGEVGGVVVAGFPVDLIKNPAKEVTSRYLTFYGFGILAFAALISLFFDRLVMRNLYALSSIFKTRFSGDQEQRIIDRLTEKDEIEGLIEGVDELAVCLSDARNELEDYTQNLEQIVDERTKEINVKAEHHQADVGLFVKILSRFGEASSSKQVIESALDSIGLRFNADQVIYYCAVSTERSYAWKRNENIDPLREDIKEILWKEEVLFSGNRLYVPVITNESHWGILSISWSAPPEMKELTAPVLLGLGRQLAILIENIQAFSDVKFQNDMFQSVFEGISDPLLLIDGDGHLLMANKGAGKILLKQSNKDREKELHSFLASHRDPDVQDNVLSKLREKGKPISQEIKTVDDKAFKVYLYPLPKRDQAALRIVLYARDVTMEKQMMTRMQQAERLSSIGKMAAGVAHEINNPLGVISCYTDLVRDAVNDPDTLADLNVIEKHTKNVQKVVQELLKLSRPKQEVTGVSDVNRVVADAIKVFKAQSALKNIRVSSKLQDGLPDIKCDSAILEQILTNMWINAFDAIQGEGGEVKITTQKVENSPEVLLRIEDTGSGIPDSILDQIFDPFFTTKELGKGTGLGLAVVYGFVTDLGGRIEVEQTGMTRFNIFFPCQDRKPKG
jgi:signal transduction histidine kinase